MPLLPGTINAAAQQANLAQVCCASPNGNLELGEILGMTGERAIRFAEPIVVSIGHRVMIAAMATSDPKMDVAAVAIASQSRLSFGSLRGTVTVLPGNGWGWDCQSNRLRCDVSTFPFG